MIDPDSLFEADADAAAAHLDEEAERAVVQLEASSWNAVDLTEALLMLGSLKPTMLEMADGQRLVYPGRTHWFQGEPASLKSFAAQYAVCQQLLADRDCCYIDFESNVDEVVNRLRSLGASEAQVRDHFAYIRPKVGTTASLGDMLAVDRLIKSRDWAMFILDGVTGSFSLEGLDPNSGADVARWMMVLPERAAATGAAVIVIDHVTKSTEGRGRWAVGSGHKLAALDGVSLTFENFQRLYRAGPDDVQGITGKSTVTLNKDRGGWITTGENNMVGTFTATAYPDGGLVAEIGEIESGVSYSMDLMVKVAKVVNIYAGSTSKAVADRVEGASEREVNGVLMEMVGRKWMAVEQVGQSHKHSLTSLGRAETIDV